MEFLCQVRSANTRHCPTPVPTGDRAERPLAQNLGLSSQQAEELSPNSCGRRYYLISGAPGSRRAPTRPLAPPLVMFVNERTGRQARLAYTGEARFRERKSCRRSGIRWLRPRTRRPTSRPGPKTGLCWCLSTAGQDCRAGPGLLIASVVLIAAAFALNRPVALVPALIAGAVLRGCTPRPT